MARLPNPGADSGTWGDILNDFLGVEHNSDGSLKIHSDGSVVTPNTVTAKGDLLAASAPSTISRLPAGNNGQLLTVDSVASTGLSWKDPDHAPATNYPLQAYGFHSASADLDVANTNSVLIGAFFVRIFVPAGKAINALGAIVSNAGTLGAGGLNSFAVYDDTGNFVASTPNDDSQWTSTGWLVKTLASPIPAQASDRFIYAAASCDGYSSVAGIIYLQSNPYISDGGGYLVNKRRSFYTSISSWPGSLNPQSFGNGGNGWIALIALA